MNKRSVERATMRRTSAAYVSSRTNVRPVKVSHDRTHYVLSAKCSLSGSSTRQPSQKFFLDLGDNLASPLDTLVRALPSLCIDRAADDTCTGQGPGPLRGRGRGALVLTHSSRLRPIRGNSIPSRCFGQPAHGHIEFHGGVHPGKTV